MAGHSKWKQIKRAKGVADHKRSQVFTRLGREVSVAARAGGSDPEMNPRLRLAIDRARAENMPKDNIERAIKRATGEGGEGIIEEVTYEGYGPGGIAVLVQALTDNRNRTASEVRNAFAKAGGSLGEAGSVAWQFDTRGVISVDANGRDADDLALIAIDSGAEDVQIDGTSIEIYTTIETLDHVRNALAVAGIEVESAEISLVPKNTIEIESDKAGQALRLLDNLDDLDDVQRVASNADFSEEALAAFA
jgi:YebC/PmpR family DNA-binding regulatory protein